MAENTEKKKALEAAMSQIEKQFGKGSVMKLGEFKAEYLGKMNLYLEALDRDVKKNKRIQVLELYYVVLKMKMLLNIQ